MKSRPIILRNECFNDTQFKDGILYRCIRTVGGNNRWIGAFAWRVENTIYIYRLDKSYDYGGIPLLGHRYKFVSMPAGYVLTYRNDDGEIIKKTF